MTQKLGGLPKTAILYPESEGKPMAENINPEQV
jgi:hypothetical protein